MELIEMRVYERFFDPGDVVEIRALGLHGKSQAWEGFCGGAGVVAGYFNDPEPFDRAAKALDEAGAAGVYFTLNPVKPELLARAVNRLKASPKYLTQDADIKCIRWIPIDLDPVRPPGISSNQQELDQASAVARNIVSWLETELNFQKSLRGCSGNGYHIMYRVKDWPNDPDHQAMVRGAIEAVAGKCSTRDVDVDLKVFNPARIWKLYGTTGRKGDSTEDRPHRKSYLFKEQPEALADVGVVSDENIRKLCHHAPKKEDTGRKKQAYPGKQGKTRAAGQGLGKLDLDKFLGHYGVAYNMKVGKGGVSIYRLEHCLFDPNHGKNEAAINQAPDGTLSYQCFHNTCSGRRWQDARDTVSGQDSLAQFCEGYDPAWRPSGKKTKTYKSLEAQGKPFLSTNSDNRVQFNCAKMANFLEDKFKPFLYEGRIFGDCFYRYKSGVWQIFPEDGIRRSARIDLEDYARPKWIGDAVQTLKDQTYQNWQEMQFDPMWLNLQNGMLHVETQELEAHSPDFYSRVQLPVTYREDATCPRWIEAVMEFFSDDLQKGEVLQEFFGYCLYPKILFPAALFQIGQGRNGKGVVERILCAMLGQANVSHISLARMEDKFGPAELRDKLLNSTGETESKPLHVTTFKAAVAGDEIQAEVKYKSDIKFMPIAKHMISMNSFPGLKEKTDAFFRRIIVLEYNQQFDGDQEDKRLSDKLMPEMDGIFKWALDGLRRVLTNEEIITPKAVIRAKKRFKAKVNPVLMYVEEMCTLGEAQQGGIRVLPKDLFNSYQEWMEESRLKALGKQNFYEQIYLNYPEVDKKRASHGTREFFYGLGLRTNPKAAEV